MSKMDMALGDIIGEDNSDNRRGGGRRGGGRGRRGGGGYGPVNNRGNRSGGGGGGGGGRFNPYGMSAGPAGIMIPHHMLQAFQQPQQGQGSLRPTVSGGPIKVSSSDNPATVAATIAYACRNGECPNLLVTGPKAVNQAVKAVAIARKYLSTDELRHDLACEPWFREEEKDAVQFSMLKLQAPRFSMPETTSVRVAASSQASKVAGSIANSIRQGERVAINAMGAGCVDVAVASVCLARRYLKTDGMGLHFRPSFDEVNTEDGSTEGGMTIVKFSLYASQI